MSDLDDPPGPEAFVLDLDGYEGPIDLLLALAREQKLDLARISILALAEQYLDFIAAQPRLDLAVAADWLVMAAVLAWLKSRLLLPAPASGEEEPEAAEVAEGLRHRLALLEAMQRAGSRLMARPLCGRDVFLRGAPEEIAVDTPIWRLGIYELLRAYADNRRRRTAEVMAIRPSGYHSIDEALQRFGRLLGRMANWRELSSFLPRPDDGDASQRSAVAATFAAALELARTGRLQLRQDRAFGPIWLRRAGRKSIAAGVSR